MYADQIKETIDELIVQLGHLTREFHTSSMEDDYVTMTELVPNLEELTQDLVENVEKLESM